MSGGWPTMPFTSQSGRAALRVGDVERDEAARVLGEHFAAGRLDRDEYDERSTLALTARTGADLDALFRDLPPTEAAGAQRTSNSSGPRRPSFRRPPLLPVLLVLLVVAVVLAAPWLFWVGLGLFLFTRGPGCRGPWGRGPWGRRGWGHRVR